MDYKTDCLIQYGLVIYNKNNKFIKDVFRSYFKTYIDTRDNATLSDAKIYTNEEIQKVNNTITTLDEKVEDYNRNTHELITNVSNGIINDYKTEIKNERET